MEAREGQSTFFFFREGGEAVESLTHGPGQLHAVPKIRVSVLEGLFRGRPGDGHTVDTFGLGA